MARYDIVLDGLKVAIRLGVHPHEATPQRVRIDVRMTVDYGAPIREDAIAAVLDYNFVRDGILSLAAGPGFDLQETLVEAIAGLCLADHRVVEVRVASTKLDIYPDATVGCQIERRRDDG